MPSWRGEEEAYHLPRDSSAKRDSLSLRLCRGQPGQHFLLDLVFSYLNVHLFNTDFAAGPATKEKTSFIAVRLLHITLQRGSKNAGCARPTSSVFLPVRVTGQYHRMQSAQRRAWSRTLNTRTVKGGLEELSCEDTCHLFQTAKQSSTEMILRVILRFGEEYAHAKDIHC